MNYWLIMRRAMGLGGGFFLMILGGVVSRIGVTDVSHDIGMLMALLITLTGVVCVVLGFEAKK